MQQWSWRYAELADVACLPAARAESFAYAGAAAGLAAAFVAWRLRDRAAASGQHALWAICAALVGVMQVLLAMFRVPTGCLSGHLFTTLVGAASPWLLAGGLLRTGVAPTPAPLREASPSRASPP